MIDWLMKWCYETTYNLFYNGLDYGLYYKVVLMDNYTKINNYINPREKNIKIVNASLHMGDNSMDITNNFKKILKDIDWENLKWDDIFAVLGDLESISDEDFFLDVKYSLEDGEYKIIYKYKEHSDVKFPYKLEDIDDYQKSTNFKKTILYAEKCNGADITKILKEYSGPMGDFYQEGNHVIHASWLKDDEGKHILLEDEVISMMDSHAEESKIKSGDILSI